MTDPHSKELAILGLGNALYADAAKELPDHEYFQEIFRSHVEAGYENIRTAEIPGCWRPSRTDVRAEYDGREFGLYEIPFGLSQAFKVNAIVRSPRVRAAAGVGFCGGLRKDVSPGTVVIARKAAISSTATDCDWKNGLKWSKADEKLADAMEVKAKARGYEVKQGKIITVMNTGCETADFFDEAAEAGFTGVEMETAVFYQAANKEECPAASVLYVSDNPILNPEAFFPAITMGLRGQGMHIKMAEIARDALLEVFKEGKE